MQPLIYKKHSKSIRKHILPTGSRAKIRSLLHTQQQLPSSRSALSQAQHGVVPPQQVPTPLGQWAGGGGCPLTQKLQTTEQDCLNHWAGLSLDTFSCPLPTAWALRLSQLLPGPHIGLPDLLSPPPHPLPPPPGPLAPSHTSYLLSSSRSLREARAPFPNPSGSPQRGNEFEGRAASLAHTAQHTLGIVLHAHMLGRTPACMTS